MLSDLSAAGTRAGARPLVGLAQGPTAPRGRSAMRWSARPLLPALLPPVLPLGVGLLAFVARLLPVLRGGGLHGVLGYDDGVCFGAAEAFVFGRLPYHDFVLLHPPGIVLALAPFAGLARLTGDDDSALAVARLVFMA